MEFTCASPGCSFGSWRCREGFHCYFLRQSKRPTEVTHDRDNYQAHIVRYAQPGGQDHAFGTQTTEQKAERIQPACCYSSSSHGYADASTINRKRCYSGEAQSNLHAYPEKDITTSSASAGGQSCLFSTLFPTDLRLEIMLFELLPTFSLPCIPWGHQ